MPAERSAGDSAPGSSPPRVAPATPTRHFPHRLSPPQGASNGTPARRACERRESSVDRGTSTPSGRNRTVPLPASTIRGEERRRWEPAEIRREGGGLLRADEDTPPRKFLDPSGETRHHAGQDQGAVAHLSL